MVFQRHHASVVSLARRISGVRRQDLAAAGRVPSAQDRGSKIEDRGSNNDIRRDLPYSILDLRSSILDPRSSILDPRSYQLSAILALAASLRICFSNQAIR